MPSSTKFAIALCAAFSAVGMLFGGLANEFETRALVVYGFIGAFLGAVGAPEVEPKYFKYPAIWQVTFATFGCVLFAHSVAASYEGYLVAVLIGIILGYTAPFWIKYVVFP